MGLLEIDETKKEKDKGLKNDLDDELEEELDKDFLSDEIEPSDEMLHEIENEIKTNRRRNTEWLFKGANIAYNYNSTANYNDEIEMNDYIEGVKFNLTDDTGTVDGLHVAEISNPVSNENMDMTDIHENPIRDRVSLLSEPIADYFYEEIFSGEINEKGLYYNSDMKKFSDKAECLQSEWKSASEIFISDLKAFCGGKWYNYLKKLVRDEYPDEKPVEVLEKEYVCVSEYRAADGSNTAIFQIGEFDVRDAYYHYGIKTKK